MLNGIAPFFIVDDLTEAVGFYETKLGFHVCHKGGDAHGNDFWALVARDQVAVMLKHITPELHPTPNPSRHEWAAWDAYIFTDDPDSLYAEFLRKHVPVRRPLSNTADGLRAFEITDSSGYVLCFGMPVEAGSPSQG